MSDSEACQATEGQLRNSLIQLIQLAKRKQRILKGAPGGRDCVFCDVLRGSSHYLAPHDEYGFKLIHDLGIGSSFCDYQLAPYSVELSTKGDGGCDNYNNLNDNDDEKRKYMGVHDHRHWCHMKCLSFYLMLYNYEIQSCIEEKKKEKNESNSNSYGGSWNYHYDYGYEIGKIPLIAECLKCPKISRTGKDCLTRLQPKDLITGFVYQMYSNQKDQQQEEVSLNTFTIKVEELMTRFNTYKEYLVELLRDFETETLKREYIEQATRVLATLVTKPKDDHDDTNTSIRVDATSDKDVHVNTNYSSHSKLISRLNRLMFINYSWLVVWLLVVFPLCVVLSHTIFKDNDSAINIIQIANLECSILAILCHILEIILRTMLYKMEAVFIEFLGIGNSTYRSRKNINNASNNNPQPLWPVFRAYNSNCINQLVVNTFELQFIEQQKPHYWSSNSMYKFSIKRKQYQKQQLRVYAMLMVVVLVCFVFMWIAPMETLRVNSDRLGIGILMIIVTIGAAIATWLIVRSKSRDKCDEYYHLLSAVYWGLMSIFAFIHGLLSVFTVVGDQDIYSTYRSTASGILLVCCGPAAWCVWCFGYFLAHQLER